MIFFLKQEYLKTKTIFFCRFLWKFPHFLKAFSNHSQVKTTHCYPRLRLDKFIYKNFKMLDAYHIHRLIQ